MAIAAEEKNVDQKARKDYLEQEPDEPNSSYRFLGNPKTGISDVVYIRGVPVRAERALFD